MLTSYADLNFKGYLIFFFCLSTAVVLVNNGFTVKLETQTYLIQNKQTLYFKEVQNKYNSG